MNPPRIGSLTQVKFNQGKTLLHLAKTYPTLHEVVLELVQNALDTDVNATRVFITINYKTRYLSVRDNGAGVSVIKFNQALGSVAEPKRKGARSLGEFGIGLISPLGKCEYYTFTSCPAPHKGLYQQWTLNTCQIENQAGDIIIPTQPRNDLIFEDKLSGKKTVEWRTEVILENIVTDGIISRIIMDNLIGSIQDRYSTVMLANKVLISIRIIHADSKEEKRDNVTGLEFKGRKLEEQELVSPYGGKVVYKMYIARKNKSGRKGKVRMGVIGKPFRFPFQYVAQVASKLLSEEVVTALSSGLFEGEILSEQAKIHADRECFDRDDNFIGLCITIEEWFQKYGKEHMEEARQNRQDERFQELGMRSMKVLKKLLDDPEHSILRDLIKTFERGSVGIGHTPIGQTRQLGEQDKKALSVVNGNPGMARKKDDKKSSNPAPSEALPNHVPLTVTGPKGQLRKLVRGHSLGLAFDYDPADGSPELWKLDIHLGILRFNICHKLWVRCDEKSDSTIMKFQEYIAMQALTLQLMPENLRDNQRLVLDELNISIVSWLLSGDLARGTIPTPKKKSKDKEG